MIVPTKRLVASVAAAFCLLATHVCAQTSTTDYSQYKSLSELPGVDITKQTVTSDDEYSTTDKTKSYLLYNVATNHFVTAAGYWGTHISLHEYGIRLWLKSPGTVYTNENRRSTVSTSNRYGIANQYGKSGDQQGDYIEWSNIGEVAADYGVYMDRGAAYGWCFEPVNDGKNTYKIYTRRTTQGSYSSGGWGGGSKTTYYYLSDDNSASNNYYLCAAPSADADQDKLCGGAKTTESFYNEDRAKWRLISVDDYFKFLRSQVDMVKQPLDLTFLLKDPGFGRSNGQLDGWTAWNYTNNQQDNDGNYLKFRIGLEDRYRTTISSSDPSSWSYLKKPADEGSYQRDYGKYYCAAIKGSRGTLYQDMQVGSPGWYIIECKGYSNTKAARLFAKLKDTNQAANAPEQVTYMTQEDQQKFAVDSMLSAGKEFYGNKRYLTSVMIRVDSIDGKIVSDDNPATIRFGISVGDLNNTTAESDEWTVFDEFRILYATGNTQSDLILDETMTDMTHITDVRETYTNRVLHLMRNFSLGTWNTLYLPVNISKVIFNQQFGANAKLAKLLDINGSTLRFVRVDIDGKGEDDTVIEQYVPYLIWPTKDHGECPEYTANLTSRDDEYTKRPVTVAQDHYTMYPVSLDYTPASESADNMDKNILLKDDGDTWLRTQEGTGDLEALGLFCQNYSNGKILEGRSTLSNCYIMKSNTLYLVPAGKSYGSKGLRTTFHWKDTATSPGANAKVMTIDIDGIEDDVTAIQIAGTLDDEPSVERYAQGVYSINGQKVSDDTTLASLPAGLYIVNGRKVIK